MGVMGRGDGTVNVFQFEHAENDFLIYLFGCQMRQSPPTKKGASASQNTTAQSTNLIIFRHQHAHFIPALRRLSRHEFHSLELMFRRLQRRARGEKRLTQAHEPRLDDGFFKPVALRSYPVVGCVQEWLRLRGQVGAGVVFVAERTSGWTV